MNTRFCASCGTGTPYTAIKPTFCSKCGKGFEAAFAAAPIKAVHTPQSVHLSPVQAPYQPPQSQRRFVGARGRNVPNPYVEQPQEPVYGGEEYIDQGAVYEAAQALASTISKSDFVCGVEDDSTHHGRLARPSNTQQVQQPKISRRKRSG